MINNNRKSYDAILVDLDGTLIDLDLNKFIPAYVDALAKRFTGRVDHDGFIRHLLQATLIMVKNRDPHKKNKVVFYEEFCSRIGYTFEEIEPIIDDFYRKDFPNLSCWGQELPFARLVVETAQKKNLPLILATNPLFPLAAVLHRLTWAGLNSDDFKLVTTMDNMHYCKPNPEYYLEISQKIDCPPERCLMAGNDTLEDLIAAEVGMDTFLVEDFILHRAGIEPVSNYRGSLEDLAAFIENLES